LACDEIIAGRHDDMFPLHVWMTGSGTQFKAAKIAQLVFERGLARVEKPADVYRFVRRHAYEPRYPNLTASANRSHVGREG
jgi:hypothetical protein